MQQGFYSFYNILELVVKYADGEIIFIERLWRSIKYELIYIKAFDDGIHLKQDVKHWFTWYSQTRPHQALDYKTPEQVYLESLAIAKLTSSEVNQS